jgi:hypothetical protein
MRIVVTRAPKENVAQMEDQVRIQAPGWFPRDFSLSRCSVQLYKHYFGAFYLWDPQKWHIKNKDSLEAFLGVEKILLLVCCLKETIFPQLI